MAEPHRTHHEPLVTTELGGARALQRGAWNRRRHAVSRSCDGLRLAAHARPCACPCRAFCARALACPKARRHPLVARRVHLRRAIAGVEGRTVPHENSDGKNRARVLGRLQRQDHFGGQCEGPRAGALAASRWLSLWAPRLDRRPFEFSRGGGGAEADRDGRYGRLERVWQLLELDRAGGLQVVHR